MSIWKKASNSATYTLLYALAGVALVVAGTSMMTSRACAGAYAVCDGNYMAVLKEKAHVEAQREVQMNNTIITKPASVLALSCFDQHVRQVSRGGSIFTDNNGSGPISNWINTTIGSSFNSFISSNFDEPSIGSGTTFSSGGSYGSCNRLKQLWQDIKCASSQVNINRFMTLSELSAAAADPRTTTNYTCTKPAAVYTAGVRAATDLNASGAAHGGAAAYFNTARPQYCKVDAKEGTDAMANSRICQNGGTDVRCGDEPAIPTGLVVSYTQAVGSLPANTQVWSYRCINPGCYFDVSANQGSIRYTAGGTPPTDRRCAYRPY